MAELLVINGDIDSGTVAIGKLDSNIKMINADIINMDVSINSAIDVISDKILDIDDELKKTGYTSLEQLGLQNSQLDGLDKLSIFDLILSKMEDYTTFIIYIQQIQPGYSNKLRNILDFAGIIGNGVLIIQKLTNWSNEYGDKMFSATYKEMANDYPERYCEGEMGSYVTEWRVTNGSLNLINGNEEGSLSMISCPQDYSMGKNAIATGLSTKALSSNAHTEGVGSIACDGEKYWVTSFYPESSTILFSDDTSILNVFGTLLLYAEYQSEMTLINSIIQSKNDETREVVVQIQDIPDLENITVYYCLYPGFNEVSSNHAEGYQTLAMKSSHAEGKKSFAIDFSHAEGDETEAYTTSHAEGVQTNASGTSHAEGFQTNADDMSHAEGNGTSAVSTSHAEGIGSEAIGYCTHAQGFYTKATGNMAHAQGDHTEATGNYSMAGGVGTIASTDYSTILGKYGVSGPNTLFGIGNGTSTTPKMGMDYTSDDELFLAGKKVATEEVMNTAVQQKSLQYNWLGTTLGIKRMDEASYTYSPDLKGQTGATGLTGPQGPVGATGSKGDPGAGLQLKGIVATVTAIPTTGISVNDAYLAQDTGLIHFITAVSPLVYTAGIDLRGTNGSVIIQLETLPDISVRNSNVLYHKVYYEGNIKRLAWIEDSLGNKTDIHNYPLATVTMGVDGVFPTILCANMFNRKFMVKGNSIKNFALSCDNLANLYAPSLVTVDPATSRITMNSNNGAYVNAHLRTAKRLLPSTKYKIVAIIYENTLNGTFFVNDTAVNEAFTASSTIAAGGVGTFSFVRTTKADLSAVTMDLRSIISTNATTGRIVYNVMILEELSPLPRVYISSGVTSVGDLEGGKYFLNYDVNGIIQKIEIPQPLRRIKHRDGLDPSDDIYTDGIITRYNYKADLSTPNSAVDLPLTGMVSFRVGMSAAYYPLTSDLYRPVCNILNSLPQGDHYNDNGMEGVCTRSGYNYVYFKLLKTRLTGWSDALSPNDKNALFASWLATNGCVVIYKLATTINEPVTSIGTIDTVLGNNTVKNVSSVLPGSGTISFYQTVPQYFQAYDTRIQALETAIALL